MTNFKRQSFSGRRPRPPQPGDQGAERGAGRRDGHAGVQLAARGRGGALQRQVVPRPRGVLSLHTEGAAAHEGLPTAWDRG